MSAPRSLWRCPCTLDVFHWFPVHWLFLVPVTRLCSLDCVATIQFPLEFESDDQGDDGEDDESEDEDDDDNKK